MHEKCPNMEVFLVRIWTLFTQCDEIKKLGRLWKVQKADNYKKKQVSSDIKHGRQNAFQRTGACNS